MNTLNELETRLRFWTPRSPSRTLEQRLFPPAAPQQIPARERIDASANWPAFPGHRWVATAALAALAGVAALWQTSAPAGRKPLSSATMFAGIALSNPPAISFHTTRDHSGWNHWHTPIIKWTNFALLPSSAPRFPLVETNSATP